MLISKGFYCMISNLLNNHKASLKKVFGNNTLSESQNKLIRQFFYTVVIGTFVSMLGIILYYAYSLAALSNGIHSFDWLLGIFSDFVAIMEASLLDDPYTVGGASYPPVAIFALYPFAFICKDVFALYKDLPLTIDELTSRVVLHKEFWIAMILFWVICSICVVVAINARYKFGVRNSLLLSIMMILSAPFTFAVMRGNTIYFALIFLLLFLLLYEHKNPAVREIAYICLVISGAIKIYPLFFGVFLLHKKKFFAALRIGVYSVALFCLSFLLVKSGFNDFNSFFENLGGFITDNLRLLEPNNLSTTSLLYKVFYLISPNAANSNVFSFVNLGVIIVLFVLSAITASITRSAFSRSVIAASIVILIPSISYFYILSLTTIPFMEFIKNYDNFDRRKQLIYKLFFGFIFFTPFIIAKNFIIHALIILSMLIIENYNVVKNEIFKRS